MIILLSCSVRLSTTNKVGLKVQSHNHKITHTLVG